MIIDIKMKISLHIIIIIYFIIREEIMQTSITQIFFVFFVLYYCKVIFLEYQRRKLFDLGQNNNDQMAQMNIKSKKLSDMPLLNDNPCNSYQEGGINTDIDFNLVC